MTFKAPPRMQDLGNSAERELFRLIATRLAARGSKAIVLPGPDDSRDNGEYGDCLIVASEGEMEIMTLEFKNSDYAQTFSLSDYEKRVSVAKWVIVKGSRGIWAVPMAVAREHLNEREKDGGKYWVCYPPFSSHVTIDTVLNDIQRTLGEIE